MKNMHNHPETHWENRELGASEKHVRKVSEQRSKKIDEALGLQMISIRLQKELIDALKLLAQESGIGYQPYIRHILSKHVQKEKGATQQRIS